MLAATSIVKAQIDSNIKHRAEDTLKALGLDLTSGIRMFLNQVVLRGGIPFEVKLPIMNRETLDAIADSYSGKVETASSVDALFRSVKD
jgi:DNA-damage-inducible protein J